ncbi:hypothetical protein SAMN05660657_05358 [Geodermatophilus amargosae]|uniref:Uncharacterized protein n=1 Tax=Geodermatophilus amargosae TaxID=1296565 RepID=A0A1I7D686_9ACTN|nr:hypothetical protein [Geodermatophilus amargosae]SFU07155.1 hypothetical protein SAMN05660657_05358 [Geodermatophilus amargosae]
MTHAIDDYSSFATSLGERFLYYRVSDVTPQQRRSSSHRRRMPKEKRRENARALARRAITDGRRRVSDVELTDDLLDLIDDVTEVVRAGRGAVPRDTYGRRDIIGEAKIEEPYRMRQELQRLARALVALQLSEEDVARLTVRCGLDSMPRTRRKVLGALAATDAASVAALARTAGGIDRKVVRRTVEDLRALGLAACPVLEQIDTDDEADAGGVARDWQLSDARSGRLARRVLTAQVGREGCSQTE